jgi:hypothetical protein
MVAARLAHRRRLFEGSAQLEKTSQIGTGGLATLEGNKYLYETARNCHVHSGHNIFHNQLYIGHCEFPSTTIEILRELRFCW